MTYLLKSFKNIFEKIIKSALKLIKMFLNYFKILIYLLHRKSFGIGYDEYKWYRIQKKINSESKEVSESNSKGIDERIIEYKWLLNELEGKSGKLLDAGSTLNYEPIIKKLNKFEVFIQTLYPEKNNFYNYSVNYIYSDLSKKIYIENSFDYIACISTLEHVGFDNSQYDYKKNFEQKNKQNNPKDYLKVIDNFKFILKPAGALYLTLPFGYKEVFNHLQQFDKEEIDCLIEKFSPTSVIKSYYIYKKFGWHKCEEDECKDTKFRTQQELNPEDKAASARSVIFLKLVK